MDTLTFELTNQIREYVLQGNYEEALHLTEQLKEHIEVIKNTTTHITHSYRCRECDSEVGRDSYCKEHPEAIIDMVQKVDSAC